MRAAFSPFWVPVAAFLIGAVPFSFLIARLRGVDIRTIGSGNIGATNLARAAGPALGLLGLLLDALKGSAAVWLAMAAGPAPDAGRSAAAGVAAILGHGFTPFLKFRGGKGVATGAGVFAVLCPTALLAALALFLVLLALFRWVSLGSVAAAIMLPLAARLLAAPRPVVLAAAAVAILTIVRHRANLARLLAGTEPRLFGRSAP